MTREIEVDVCIVGAGPAGLYATYYAGFRGLTVALVDALVRMSSRSVLTIWMVCRISSPE